MSATSSKVGQNKIMSVCVVMCIYIWVFFCIHLATPCLLVGAFGPFTFQVIIIIIIIIIIIVFLPFLGPLPWQMEVPRLGV